MNIGATAGANAAIIASLARSKVIEHFQKAGALSPETAVPMPTKNSRHVVDGLIKHKVLVPAGEGLFYVDLDANKRWQRDQARVAIGVVVVLVVLLGVVLIGLALTG